MGLQYWPEPKNSDASDRYQITVPSSWLEGESITSAVWEAEAGSGLTVTGELITGAAVSALFSGGNAGAWLVTVSVSTTTRTNKDFCAKLLVGACG